MTEVIPAGPPKTYDIVINHRLSHIQAPVLSGHKFPLSKIGPRHDRKNSKFHSLGCLKRKILLCLHCDIHSVHLAGPHAGFVSTITRQFFQIHRGHEVFFFCTHLY